MARSTPGCSQTRQTRLSRCCMVVIPSSGSLSPYSGCVGSMTSTVSVGSAVSSIEVVSLVRFAGARRSNQEHILFGAHPFERRDVLKGWARDGRVSYLECLQRLEHRKTTLLESDSLELQTTRGRVL